MKQVVYVYKNGMCAPERKMGLRLTLEDSKQIDLFVENLVSKINVRKLGNYRIFVANPEVPQEDIDHYTLFGEALNQNQNMNKFKEVNIAAVAMEVHPQYRMIIKRREEKNREFDKKLKEGQLNITELINLRGEVLSGKA